MAVINIDGFITIELPEIKSIKKMGPFSDYEVDSMFFDTEHEFKIVGSEFTSDMKVYFKHWLATIKPGTLTRTEAVIITPKIPKYDITEVKVQAENSFGTHVPITLRISENPFKTSGTIEDTVTAGASAAFINSFQDTEEPEFITPLDEALEEEVLRKVFLDSTTDDLSTDSNKRNYGIEQVRKYQEAIDGIKGKTFTDHLTDIYIYDSNDSHITESKETNFYIRKYEETQANKNIRTMPFYYSNSVSDGVILSSIVENNKVDVEKRNQFYKNWRFSNKLNQSVFFKELYEPNDKKAFPRYAEIEIELEPSIQGFSKEINSSELEGLYDKFCMKYIKDYDQEQKRKYAITGKDYLSIQEMGSLQVGTLFQDVELEETHTLEGISVITSPTSLYEEANLLDDMTTNISITNSEAGQMQSLMRVVRRKINKRSYHDILSGQSAKTEPFLYEIRKYDASGSKVNSFYLPARLYHSPNKSNMMRFIDTQVSHGQRYSYELVSHQIIYGESYKFIEDLDFDQLSHPLSAEVDIGKLFDVEVFYDTRIFPVTIASWESHIEARPGLAPSVKIIPQKNKNGMPKFFLQSSFGQNTFDSPEDLYPPLSSEEVSKNQRTIRDFSENGRMSFHSRFQNKHYEVYRLANKPTEIEDFSGALIARVSPLYSDDLSFGASAVFEDNIVKNKKYYYLFRAVDVWGTPTLSTGPFEYEIISDGKSSVVNFKPYDIHSDVVPQGEVNARNVVRLSPHPRELQIPIGEEELSLSSAFSYVDAVGQPLIDYLRDKMTRESKFWNKKYKIRVVSKKTGRKIDIIFTPRLTKS